MTAANVTPLVPEATPASDLIADALAKLKQDPGALFEVEVLVLLRQARKADPARWARIRHAAKEAKSVSLADLDKLTQDGANDSAEGDSEIFPEVTLWPTPVDGAELLDGLAIIIRRHVIADPATIHAAALWAALTWFIDVVNVAPIANVTAPEKRCGKTVLLGLPSAGRVQHRPRRTVPCPATLAADPVD
ncbi:hypothetical protein SAMN05216206_3454 [Pseudomonas guineae]|uniref:Uncharacterized protein n=1 Tax=Pseudomonas guineae TaxID=425504 RepID=A0A1I3NEU6_9PSED|nr:hypothetical protein [Pseudomonas guineae]SFJ07679.1 hypothetical protein SAMN05216206_3454 [Pseudomonas guineae]